MNYVFKIIPMLNIEGVIHGRYEKHSIFIFNESNLLIIIFLKLIECRWYIMFTMFSAIDVVSPVMIWTEDGEARVKNFILPYIMQKEH